MNEVRVTFTGVRNVELQKLPRPRPADAEVLVRNLHTLLSPGTELAMYEGTHAALHDPENLFAKYPHYPGYAAIGLIEECGAEVQNAKAGDLVLYLGTHSTWSLMRPATDIWLALAEPFSPDKVLFARLTQIAATAYHCLRRAPERAIVLGAGMIGVLAAQVLQVEGVKAVVVQDIIASRLDLARRCGVRRTALGAGRDLAPSLLQLDGKPDAIIEATGLPLLVPAALASVRPGGDVVLLGSPRGPLELDLYQHIHRKGVALIGAHEIALPDRAPDGQPSRQRSLEQALRWLNSGAIRVDGLVTDVVRPPELPATYERMSADKSNVLGVIVDWT